MIIVLLIVAIIVASIIIDRIFDCDGFLIGVSCVVALLLTIIIANTQAGSMDTAGKRIADRETRVWAEYNSIIQAQVDAAVIGDYSNAQVGSELASRIQQWYQWVIDINTDIKTAQLYNDSYLFDWFIYDWPMYPKLITDSEITEFSIKKSVNNMAMMPLLNITGK